MTTTAETQAGAPEGSARRREGRRLTGWARRRPVRAALVLLLAFVLLTGVLPLAAAALPLLQAREAMEAARAELGEADPDAALPYLERAEARFRFGRLVLRNPLTLGARVVPGLSQNVRAAGVLAAGGELTAGAALRVTDALEDLGGPSAFVPRDRAVPLEPVGALGPVLAAAAADLAEAEQLVGSAPVVGLAPPLEAARREFLGELEATRPPVEAAAALADVLPRFLGAEEPQRYLLTASNPAELRGSGGLIGSHAILEISDGRLSFEDFEPTPDLEPVSPEEIEPPHADYAARYDRFGAGGFFLNLNMTPDFPSAGLAAQRLYEHVSGERVDGVILADPHVFAALLKAGGPLEAPGGRTLDADDVVAYIASEAYADFESHEERKRVLGAVAAGAVQRLLDPGTGDPAEMAQALAAAARAGHLLVYADEADVQAAFDLAGLSGALPRGDDGDVLVTAVNNASNNKVDFWLERSLRYEVELQDDGSARGDVVLELHNGAPTEGYPAHVIGPNVAEGLEAGDAYPIVSLFCAPGCRTEEFRVDGAPREAVVEEELGLPVHTVQDRIPSGADVTIEAQRVVPDGWLLHSHGEAGWYRLVLDAQTAIRPAAVDLTVTVPEGYEVIRTSADLESEGRRVTFAGELNGQRVFDVHFALPADERLRGAVQRFWQRPVLFPEGRR